MHNVIVPFLIMHCHTNNNYSRYPGQNGTNSATSYAQDYAIPIPRSADNAIYQTVGQAPQPYEAPSVSMAMANQMSAGAYEVPSITRATTNGRGNEYQTIEPGSPTRVYHTLEPTVVCVFEF